ncbi:MAG: hypothetical protein C4551_06425 [Bacillota bacterium]|nr:MAG: hypothetical protein C4551_06425 [Bacillota bacterium]
MRARVRSEIVEPTEGFWTDVELNYWLNEANEIATTKAGIRKLNPDFSTVSGTAGYALPSDFLNARRVRCGGYDLLPGTLEDWTGESGTPTRYYVMSGESKVYLDPVPNAVLTVKLWYDIRATEMTADDKSPSFPARWHHLCYLYCTGQAKRKADDPGYVTYLRDWESGVQEMCAELASQGQAERPRHIIDDWDEYPGIRTVTLDE